MPDTSPALRIFALPPNVVLQQIEDDALVVHLDREDVFALNATGARIVELLVSGLEVERVVETLSREFATEPDRVASDVDALVAALVGRGLLSPATR